MWDVFEEKLGDGRLSAGFWRVTGRLGSSFFTTYQFIQGHHHVFLCGVACMTSSARMLYAFSRDGAVPGSKWLHTVHPVVGIPVNAVLAVTAASIILALPSASTRVLPPQILKRRRAFACRGAGADNNTAFAGVISIAVIGLYLSYAVPMVFRVTNRQDFVPGPFFLGQRLSLLVHSLAVCWITLICVVFVLPQTVGSETQFRSSVGLTYRTSGL